MPKADIEPLIRSRRTLIGENTENPPRQGKEYRAWGSFCGAPVKANFQRILCRSWPPCGQARVSRDKLEGSASAEVLFIRLPICGGLLKERILGRMGDPSPLVLTPIRLSGYWRVKMTLPNNNVRYFGKFLSRREAEKWIEKHAWLSRQNQKLDEKPTKGRQ